MSKLFFFHPSIPNGSQYRVSCHDSDLLITVTYLSTLSSLYSVPVYVQRLLSTRENTCTDNKYQTYLSGTVVNTFQVFAVVVCVVLVCQDSRGGALFASEALARQQPRAAAHCTLALLITPTSYRHHQVLHVSYCKLVDLIICNEVTEKNVGSPLTDELQLRNKLVLPLIEIMFQF